MENEACTTACNKEMPEVSSVTLFDFLDMKRPRIFDLYERNRIIRALWTGASIVLDVNLPDNHWEVHCGKEFYERIKESCIDVEAK